MNLRCLGLLLALLAPVASTWSQPAPASVAASAAPGARDPQDKNYDKPERGWFFFEKKPKPVEPKPETPAEPPPAPPPLPRDLPPPPTEQACAAKESWSPDCGFVHPGADFEFQAKQRDALLEKMVVTPNDPKTVEAFQYYMRWVLERVSEVSNLWYYNMVQNPELDPTVKAPVSALGLRLMTDVQRGKEDEISRLLKEEGAALVFFSRHDCEFCHQMAPLVLALGKSLQVPVLNAALDGTCIPKLEQGCKTNVREPAQALQVSTVPTVFLYVPKNTFLRIGTGVTPVNTMKERAMQFFLAYRTAMLKGAQSGQAGRAAVDFSDNEDFMAGAAKVGEADGKPRMPSEDDIKQMLGAR